MGLGKAGLLLASLSVGQASTPQISLEGWGKSMRVVGAPQRVLTTLARGIRLPVEYRRRTMLRRARWRIVSALLTGVAVSTLVAAIACSGEQEPPDPFEGIDCDPGQPECAELI